MSIEDKSKINSKINISSSEKVAERARWLDRWAILLKEEIQQVVPNTGYEALAVPKVKMEKMDIRTSGRLGTEMDVNGIHKTVMINTEYLSLPDRVILEILTHQFVHHWQQAKGGKPSRITFHNKQLVDVCEDLGIYITPVKGNHFCNPSGRFGDLMYRHNIKSVETPVLPEDIGNNDWWNYISGSEDGINRRGESALIKWTCGCQDVRVGKGNFFATCSICHNAFNRSDIG